MLYLIVHGLSYAIIVSLVDYAMKVNMLWWNLYKSAKKLAKSLGLAKAKKDTAEWQIMYPILMLFIYVIWLFNAP